MADHIVAHSHVSRVVEEAENRRLCDDKDDIFMLRPAAAKAARLAIATTLSLVKVGMAASPLPKPSRAIRLP
jgi:hypothetical protein